jgi:ankyrin repeat protein
MARRARPRFRGPAADSALGEALLDVIGIVSAVGFAADVSQCAQLCGVTFRAGDRGATNDMLVQSLRLQCGAREAHAAGREQFAAIPGLWGVLQTFEGSTQLIRAAYLNNLPRVLQLIQLGATLDLVEKTWGWSALNWASRKGHEHVAKALLDGKYEGRGVTVNLPSMSGWTALMGASWSGHESVVRLLLSRGAKQELQSDNGYTALHYAVEGDHPGVVALLCAAPSAAAALALKPIAAFGSRTPLALAILQGRAACEAVLRAHGAPE